MTEPEPTPAANVPDADLTPTPVDCAPVDSAPVDSKAVESAADEMSVHAASEDPGFGTPSSEITDSDSDSDQVAPPDAALAAGDEGRRFRVFAELAHPFTWGFLAAVGALVAFSLSGALSSLSTVLVWIGAALFIALALDPMVRWLERHRMSRGMSIAVVFFGFAVAFGGLLALVIPQAIVQIGEFAKAVPGYVTSLQNAEWFKSAIAATGQQHLYDDLLNQARSWLSDPANLLALGGGALSVGTGVINGLWGAFIVVVLTLYFLASLSSIQAGIVRITPAYGRERMTGFIERTAAAVGSYVSGMGILAIINAVFAFIVLTVMGVPFASLLAVLALAITMIPMVGSLLFLILATAVSLFTSFWAGLVFAVAYSIYMQIEAYVLTPRIMNKAVNIPGSFVLIGAMVGATLLGLLGALVAVPVTATLLMILYEVFLPRQDAKTVRAK
jgi:predicted PurR-regulated permease PerM